MHLFLLLLVSGPIGEVDPVDCVSFLVGWAVLWWVEVDLVLRLGWAMSGVFWGICELSKTLGSLLLMGGFVFCLACCLA